MNFKHQLKKKTKIRFLSGILVFVYLSIAFAILRFAILSINYLLQPYLIQVIGKKILRKWENILLKIPFFNVIYSVETFT